MLPSFYQKKLLMTYILGIDSSSSIHTKWYLPLRLISIKLVLPKINFSRLGRKIISSFSSVEEEGKQDSLIIMLKLKWSHHQWENPLITLLIQLAIHSFNILLCEFIGDNLCFRRDMLRVNALSNTKFVPNFDESWHRKGRVTPNLLDY